MPTVRIIGVPLGEAPEAVRKAWVGLSLPLARGQSTRPQKYRVSGALSGPRGFLPVVLALLSGRLGMWEGYAVDTVPALAILSNANPEAANWWYREAPHMVRPDGKLVFPADVCEVEAIPLSS